MELQFIGRLIESEIIGIFSSKLEDANDIGLPAWSINTEKYYWDNRPDYYQNIALGYNYYALHWERCIPFLLMLPKAVLHS